jgi:oxygen-independent coproporphyrinogen-3 oxidase
LYNVHIIDERQTIIGVGPAAGTKAVDVATWRLDSCYNAKDLKTYMTNIDKYLNTRERLIAQLYAQNEEE